MAIHAVVPCHSINTILRKLVPINSLYLSVLFRSAFAQCQSDFYFPPNSHLSPKMEADINVDPRSSALYSIISSAQATTYVDPREALGPKTKAETEAAAYYCDLNEYMQNHNCLGCCRPISPGTAPAATHNQMAFYRETWTSHGDDERARKRRVRELAEWEERNAAMLDKSDNDSLASSSWSISHRLNASECSESYSPLDIPIEAGLSRQLEVSVERLLRTIQVDQEFHWLRQDGEWYNSERSSCCRTPELTTKAECNNLYRLEQLACDCCDIDEDGVGKLSTRYWFPLCHREALDPDDEDPQGYHIEYDVGWELHLACKSLVTSIAQKERLLGNRRVSGQRRGSKESIVKPYYYYGDSPTATEFPKSLQRREAEPRRNVPVGGRIINNYDVLMDMLRRKRENERYPAAESRLLQAHNVDWTAFNKLQKPGACYMERKTGVLEMVKTTICKSVARMFKAVKQLHRDTVGESRIVEQ